MEGTKQTHQPHSLRVRYKVLRAMSLLAPDQVELVDLALRRLEQGEETLWRSIWYPDLHYVFLESRVSSTDVAVKITLSVEVREGGFDVEVTDLLG
jgi:hypothetical protein